MENDNILLYLQRDDLPPDIRDIADEEGLETVRKLLKLFPGVTLHIPYVKSIKPLVKRYIRENMDRKPPAALAPEVGLTVRKVKEIINGMRE
jgi:hypothetical protein